MPKNIYQNKEIQFYGKERTLNVLEEYTLRHLHPRSLFIDSVGMIWSIYYLWHHNWSLALGVALIGRIIAYLASLEVDTEKMSRTTWGKIALLHLNPINMTMQIFGLVLIVYGVWQHSVEASLIGISCILLGHLAGWKNITF
jgi:hypothetical protein